MPRKPGIAPTTSPMRVPSSSYSAVARSARCVIRKTTTITRQPYNAARFALDGRACPAARHGADSRLLTPHRTRIQGCELVGFLPCGDRGRDLLVAVGCRQVDIT